MEWQVSDYLFLVSLLVAILGTLLAFFEWRRKNSLKRVEFLNKLIVDFRTDKEINDAVYVIEYKRDWYNNEFHGSDLERKIDKYLSFLSYICYLKSKKHISNSEFKFFEYKVNRAINSSDVKSYLSFLGGFSSLNHSNCSFCYLIDYLLINEYEI